MAGDLEPKEFDPNVWYHITESRVDNYEKDEFGAQFAENDDGNLQVAGPLDQYWQLQPVDDKEGRYALRCSKTGVFKQLSVCFNPDEIANSRTQPCLATSNNSDEQKWDIADWGNSTYRFINVKNGSDYVLDVHPGNPPFMNDDLRTNIPQPAQHWLMTSVKDVNDGAYSTTFTNMPTSAETTITSGTRVRTVFDNDPTSTSPSDSSSSSSSSGSSDSSSSGSSGLSAGAAAGIGIGVALGVIGLALLSFFFWYRRRRHAKSTAPSGELGPNYGGAEKSPHSTSPSATVVPTHASPQSSHVAPAWPPQQQYMNPMPAHEMSTERPIREAPGHFSSELDSTPVANGQTQHRASPGI